MAVAENPSDHDGRRQEGLLAQELATTTKEMIEDALAYTRGNQVRASEILGCNKVSMWNWIKKYGIDIDAVEASSRAGTWEYKSRPVGGAPWVSGEGVEW